VRPQRNASLRPKCFAHALGVWWNSNNFPKGGWPGDPVGTRACLHSKTQSHRSPMFNLGETCMKKSLIALAVMAAAGAASAQSSVTLFGIVDAAVSRYDSGGSGDAVTKLTNSGYNSSRLGFRGTEDLGGGTSASFWLE